MAQYIRPNTAPGFGMPMATNFQAPSTVQWVITADERRNYDTQFNNLMPVAGFLSGDQARNFLLQCNLPPVILGRIWELADITGDGKMDKHEFAIAMKLIKMKLQGVELPLALPQSMKPTGLGAPGGLMNTGFGTNVPNGRSTPGYPAASISPLNTASPQMTPKTSLSRHSSLNEGSSRPGQEWAIPKHTKLKYNQLFNSNDRTKTGYMSGMQARHILNGTGVAQMVLAKIWQLSDIDNDGKLSQEEFVLAMHLTDVAKSGNQIPVVLPANLIPPSYRPNKSTSSGQLGLLTPLNAMEAKVEDSMMDGGGVFASFEDRRRENFQKGNLELEKRRIALLESQQKEKHRIEQQERDIREKREKERQEQERKRQEEIERQREQLRAVEREREEQKRKALEQKESAQREMERQRQLEWERLRRKELLQLKLREQESVTSLRAKTKTLDVELNTLLEKRKQLQARAQDFESRLREQNMELEAVNKQRELKHTLVQRQQEQIQHIQQQLNAMHPEKQSLSERIQFKGSGSGHDENVQLAQRDYQSKVFTLQRLRVQLDDSDKKKHDSSVRLEQLSSQLNKLREELNKQMLATEDRSRTQQDKIRLLQEARRQKDITLIRKNSMTENKKQQERIANAALMRKRENEAHREAEEMELKRRQQQQQLQQEQQRRIEEQQKLEGERRENERKREEERRESERKREEESRESDRKRAEERRLAEEMAKKKEEEAKRKEEEQKKAEVKMKILQMQEERRKQKIIEKSEPPAHGFTLNLSKDPNHLFKYKALYSFTARNPDELTIQTGDVIIVDESQDVEPDWLAGNKNGKVGWFPANYVEKIKTTATPTPAAVMPPPQSAKPIKKTTTTNSAISSKSSAFSAAQKSAPTNLKPPDIGQRYRAIYPWIAKKDNHLSFNKDDIIAVSEHQEMWWFGHCKGKSGWFPKSYVKETTSTTPITTPKPASPKSSPLVKRKAPAPPMGSAASKKNYAAVFAFTGTEPGDLSFDVGDVIDVTSTDGEWWTGSLRGKSGIFPANYVAESAVKVPETPQPTPQTASLPKPEVATVIANYQASGAEQLSLQVGQICLIRKKNDSGWWEGELQARGKKRQVGWFPANYVKIMSNTASSGTPTPSESAKPKSTPSSETQVMAMYDYSAQNSDELSFQRGSIIMVHDQSDVDWWKGTTGGATGLFPSNYVQEIPADQ